MTGENEDTEESGDIYDLYNAKRRRTLLALMAAVYLLLPLSDTILLPQLAEIESSMHATHAVSTANMSLYLLAIGIGFLIWGPAADWLGRLPVCHLSLISFLGASVGCALAPNITALLAWRGLQGLAAAGTWAVGNAVVADVFPPSQRGMAYGVFMMPAQVGPVVAPFIGAALSRSFGWRSTMWFLAAMAVVSEAAVMVIYRETQPSRVAQRIHRQAAAAHLHTPQWVLDTIVQHTDREPQHQQQHSRQRQGRAFAAAVKLVAGCMLRLTVLPFWLLSTHAFALMFLLLLQLPRQLSAAGLDSFTIGLTYLGTGGCSMLGTLVGGWAADKAASRPNVPATARVEPACIAAAVLMPAGLLVAGWAGVLPGRQVAIAASIAGVSAACFAAAVLSPAVFSYLSAQAQAYAGAAGSIVASAYNIWAAVLTQINPAAVASRSTSTYNTALAASVFALACACTGICWRQKQPANAAACGGTGKAGLTCGTEAAEAEQRIPG